MKQISIYQRSGKRGKGGEDRRTSDKQASFGEEYSCLLACLLAYDKRTDSLYSVEHNPPIINGLNNNKKYTLLTLLLFQAHYLSPPPLKIHICNFNKRNLSLFNA